MGPPNGGLKVGAMSLIAATMRALKNSPGTVRSSSRGGHRSASRGGPLTRFSIQRNTVVGREGIDSLYMVFIKSAGRWSQSAS